MTYIDILNYDIYYDISDIRISAPLFEVDEFIAPVISLLNKKGYSTEYCCSGHLYKTKYNDFTAPNDGAYIVFSDKSQFKNIKFPIGFNVEEDDYYKSRIIITKYYTSKEGFERFFEITETIKILYDWAINLP